MDKISTMEMTEIILKIDREVEYQTINMKRAKLYEELKKYEIRKKEENVKYE